MQSTAVYAPMTFKEIVIVMINHRITTSCTHIFTVQYEYQGNTHFTASVSNLPHTKVGSVEWYNYKLLFSQPTLLQCAKKVVSESQGPVNFTVRRIPSAVGNLAVIFTIKRRF